MLPGRRRHRCLSFEDAHHQGQPPLRGPPLRRLRVLVRHGHLLDRELITVVLVDLIYCNFEGSKIRRPTLVHTFWQQAELL
jgi:hypothetical protein